MELSIFKSEVPLVIDSPGFTFQSEDWPEGGRGKRKDRDFQKEREVGEIRIDKIRIGCGKKRD